MIFKSISYTGADGSITSKSGWGLGGKQFFKGFATEARVANKELTGIAKLRDKFLVWGNEKRNNIAGLTIPGQNIKELQRKSERNVAINSLKQERAALLQAAKANEAYRKGDISAAEAAQIRSNAVEGCSDEVKRMAGNDQMSTKDVRNWSKEQRGAIKEADKAKKGFKGLSDSTKNMFKNIGAGIAIGAGIDLAFKGVEWLYNELSGKNAIDKMNERLNDYNSAMEEVSSNTSSIRSLRSDFLDLSKGVDSTGKNIGLSAEEFDKYHEVVNKLAEISPSIVKGYDAEGNAIVNRTSAIKDAIKEQEKYKKQATDAFTSNASGNDIIKGANAQMGKDLTAARKEAKKIGSALGDTTNNMATLGPSSGKANIKTYSKIINDALGEQVDLENASLTQLERIGQARSKINAAAKESGKYTRDELNNLDSSNAALQSAVAQIKEDSQPIFQWLSTAMSYSAEKGTKSMSERIPEALQEGYQNGLKDIAASGKYNDAASLRQAGTQLGEDILKEYNKKNSELKGALDAAAEAKEKFNKSQKDDAAVEAANATLGDQADKLDELAKKYKGINPELSAFYTDQANSLRDFVSNAMDLGTVFNPLKASMEEARNAKTEFDDAMSGGDMNTAINAHKEIYDTIMDDFNNAGNGTMAFWQGAEQILGAGTLKEYGYDLDKVNAKLKSLSGVMGDSKEATGAFYKMLADNKDEINSLAKNGEELVSIGSDGAISFDIDDSQLDAVADKLNISKNLLVSMIDSARHWSDIDLSNSGDVAAAIGQMDTTFKNNGKSYQFFDTIAQEAKAAGLNVGEIQQRVDELNASGKVKIFDIGDLTNPDKIVETTNALLEMNSNLGKKDGANGFKMNAEAIISQMKTMGRSAEETSTILEEYDKKGWIDSDNREKGESWADYVSDSFSTLEESDPFAGMVSSLDKVNQGINDLVLAMGSLPTNLDLTSGIDGIASDINQLSSSNEYDKEDTQAIKDKISAQEAYLKKVKETAKAEGRDEVVQQCNDQITALGDLKDKLNEMPSEKKTTVDIEVEGEDEVTSALNKIDGLSDDDKQVVVEAVAKYREDGDIQALYETIGSLPAEVQSDVIAAVFGKDKVVAVQTAINQVTGKNVQVTATAIGEGGVRSLANAISGVVSKTVTVTAKAAGAFLQSKGSGAKGTSNRRKQSHFPSRAKGGRIGPDGNGGPTLTGELGTELVWIPSQSRSFLVGQFGPEMVNLPSEAVVYPADETRRILGDTVPLYRYNFGSSAAGTDFGSAASGKYSLGRSSGSKKKKSSSGKKSSSKKSSSNSGSSSSDSESAYEKAKKALDHQLEMEYISESTYYTELNKLYNKYKKDLAKNVDDERKALEDLRKAWIDAYEAASDSLQHQLEMGTINEEQYYNKLKALGDQYYKGRKGYTKEYEKHLEELKDARKDAYDAQLDDLQRQLELEKITIENYYNQVANLQNKWLTGPEMKKDRQDAIKDLLDDLVDEMEDKMDDVDQLISDKDLFKAWSPGEDAVDDWQKFLAYLQGPDIKNMFYALEGGEKAYGDLVLKVQREIQEALNDRYDDEKDKLDEIMDLVEDLVRQETEDKIDALEEQIDKYSEIIDKKKKSLQMTEDELDYIDEMNDLASQIAKKQAEIAVLSRDDSRAGRSKLAQAQEELADLLKQQQQTQRDETLDRTEDMLDDQNDKFEESIQKQIDKLQDFLNNKSAVLEEVMKQIAERDTNKLLERLLEYNSKYGDGLNKTVTDFWEDLTGLTKKYGNDIEKIVEILQKGTDDGKTGGIIPKHHSGLATGFTGDGADLKQHEVYRLLTDDELVLNRSDQMRLANQLGVLESITSTYGGMLNKVSPQNMVSAPSTIELSVNTPITIEGSATPEAIRQLNKVGEQIADNAIERLNDALRMNGVRTGAKLNVRKK